MKTKETLEWPFESFIDLRICAKYHYFPQIVRRMTAELEKTGDIKIQPGRRRKSTRSDIAEDIATPVVENSIDNVVVCSSAQHLNVSYSTVRDVLKK